MANLNYAEQWSPELLEILMQGTLTSPFVTSNVRWLDAKTFHFTQMSTSGYKNHNRKGGWNTGTYDQKDIPYTLTHDRDVEFMVDKADVDETNATASIQNISRVFEQTWVVPETDALFFSKVAQAAQKTEGYHGSTAASTYTKAKVFGMLKDILAKGKLRRYKATGSLIMYVTSQIMDALEQSTEFTRKIEMTQIAEGGMGIETRVTDIDGVPIMEVIDDERFCRAFVNDKFRFAKWGKMKIAQGLYMKKIPSDVAWRYLNEIDEEEYLSILRALLASNRKSIHAADDYELNGKLMRFAMSRGFELKDIKRCIDVPEEEELVD